MLGDLRAHTERSIQMSDIKGQIFCKLQVTVLIPGCTLDSPGGDWTLAFVQASTIK